MTQESKTGRAARQFLLSGELVKRSVLLQVIFLRIHNQYFNKTKADTHQVSAF